MGRTIESFAAWLRGSDVIGVHAFAGSGLDPYQDGHIAGKPRSRFILSIPSNDPDLDRLYGLCEDTESMRDDYRSRMVNRRVHAIGSERHERGLRGSQFAPSPTSVRLVRNV
jgi:hypothetical protein